jgi:type I restriction enzyme S subunit
MKHDWKQVRIGEVVQQVDNSISLTPSETYTLLGMSLEGRGLFVREQKQGSEIGSKTLNKIQSGQFIYSRLFAWKGAFDFVREEFDGYYVSDEYPTFKIDETKADVKFLHYYFNQAKTWKAVEQYCIGVTKASRNRFKEKFFLDFQINLPSVSYQHEIVKKIESIESKRNEIFHLREGQTKDINNLLYSKYVELIETAEWLPMREVAPIIRREVNIKDEALYPELGIRCFGNGTFHKPALTGLEVATKKIFQIKKGDLVFSNVFAWEGGIAVAKEEDNDRYGSHRFISCVADKEKALEEFLCFHFLSPKGLEDINACSPGGAGRNKTLGLDKLMRINVPVPHIDMQKEFVGLLHKVSAMKEHHTQTDKELTELMPSLLDKAFKGEL